MSSSSADRGVSMRGRRVIATRSVTSSRQRSSTRRRADSGAALAQERAAALEPGPRGLERQTQPLGDRARRESLVVAQQDRLAVGRRQGEHRPAEAPLVLELGRDLPGRALAFAARRGLLARAPAGLRAALLQGQPAQHPGQPGPGPRAVARWAPQGRQPGVLHQVPGPVLVGAQGPGQPLDEVGVLEERLGAACRSGVGHRSEDCRGRAEWFG